MDSRICYRAHNVFGIFKCWFLFLPSLMLVVLNVESNGPYIVLKQSDFCVGVYYATGLAGTSAQSNSFLMCCYMQQAWQGKGAQ